MSLEQGLKMPLDNKRLLQAVKEVREKSEKRNFAQSIELVVNLKDIDPKKPENRFQESIELPYPPGKENKVCVIASGEMALRAKREGADLVIQRDELEALAGDKKRGKKLASAHDFFIAEAPLMPLIGRTLGTTLGPQGKMPTPVPPTADIKGQMERLRKTVLLRMRAQPVLQCRVGNEKMSDEEIAENIQATIRRIEGKLKRGIKNVSSVYLKMSMGSPVKVEI